MYFHFAVNSAFTINFPRAVVFVVRNGIKGSAYFLNAFDKGVVVKREDINTIAIVVSDRSINKKQIEVFKGWTH